MATKSFTTEFKFGKRSARKLLNAINNSKKVNHQINQRVSNISEKKEIDEIMSSYMKDK
ncbi:MAG: hypothetical protein WD037_05795 [Balneolales bacterium]